MKTLVFYFLLFIGPDTVVWADAWVVASSPTTVQLNGVVVIQDTTVYAVGANGTIVNSSNGGTLWQIQNSGLGNNVELTSICGSVPEYIVAVGGSGVAIYLVNQTLPWQKESEYSNDYYELCAIGNFVFGVVGSLGFVGIDSEAVAVGHYPTLSVNEQNSTTSLPLYGITYTSLNDGYAVGDSGIILITNSSGSSWTLEHVSTKHTLRSISSAGRNRVCAVGDAGNIWLSTDAGAHWNNVSPFGLNTNLRSISFSDSLTAVAVGDTGTILKSMDGGLTWHQQAVNTFANLRCVSCYQFESTTNWIAVGDSGTIVRTVYGGDTVAFTKNTREIYFGDVPVASQRTDSIVFTNTSGISYLTIEALPRDSNIFVSPANLLVEPFATGTIHVTYKASDTNHLNSVLLLRSDAHWIPDTVAVSGHGVEAIAVNSIDTIDLGVGNIGQKNKMFVRNNGNEALTASVQFISDSNFAVQSGATAQPGDSVAVDVSVKHDLQNNVTAFVVLQTNSAREPRDTIYITAQKVTGVRNGQAIIAGTPQLECFPNPCTISTDVIISFSQSTTSPSTLTISDIIGRVYERINCSDQESTNKTIHVTTATLRPGVYVCRFACGSICKQAALMVSK